MSNTNGDWFTCRHTCMCVFVWLWSTPQYTCVSLIHGHDPASPGVQAKWSQISRASHLSRALGTFSCSTALHLLSFHALRARGLYVSVCMSVFKILQFPPFQPRCILSFTWSQCKSSYMLICDVSVSVDVYICMYTYIYIHTHTHTHTHALITHTHPRTCACKHTEAHTGKNTHTHKHIETLMNICLYVYILNMYVCICTCTYVYIQMNVYIYIYKHVYIDLINKCTCIHF